MNWPEHKYILNGHTVVPCPNVIAWADWFETADRQVALTHINHVEVSTVFIGLDATFREGPPYVFETLVFGGPLDRARDRYPSWEAAALGHVAMVERVNAAMT